MNADTLRYKNEYIRSMRIGVIGDFDPANTTHQATNQALQHAGHALGLAVEVDWIPTPSLEAGNGGVEAILGPYDGLWCSPGSPYRSMEGALAGIRFARERGKPFVGTWGGFQHTLVEYARSILGIRDADHEESAPGAANLVITRLTCSLVGQAQMVHMMPGTLARQAYGVEEAVEQFRCNYGLNAKYSRQIAAGGLKTAGLDPDGETRIVELPGHPFYLATLFLPQMTSCEEKPHPLILAYLMAASATHSLDR